MGFLFFRPSSCFAKESYQVSGFSCISAQWCNRGAKTVTWQFFLQEMLVRSISNYWDQTKTAGSSYVCVLSLDGLRTQTCARQYHRLIHEATTCMRQNGCKTRALLHTSVRLHGCCPLVWSETGLLSTRQASVHTIKEGGRMRMRGKLGGSRLLPKMLKLEE